MVQFFSLSFWMPMMKKEFQILSRHFSSKQQRVVVVVVVVENLFEREEFARERERERERERAHKKKTRRVHGFETCLFLPEKESRDKRER